MIPRFPFRRDNFVADDYLLFFFPFALNFDYFHTTISLPLVEGNDPFNLPVASYANKKNPQRSRLEFLRAYAISLKGSVQLFWS